MVKPKATEADREATVKLLGYQNWEDATDYRLSGAQDQQVQATLAAFVAHRIAAENRAVEDQPRKQFPILGGGKGVTIDWQLVLDHEKQAKANHYQTVQQLGERGGLSWVELHAVLHNRKWERMDENTAIAECRALEAQYLQALRQPVLQVSTLMENLELACALIQEAKGAEGDMSYVVSHLDDAENWINEVHDALNTWSAK